MTKEVNGRPVLTTWQWLSVMFIIIGGLVGLDTRINSVVGSLARDNTEDHRMIKSELLQTIDKKSMDEIVLNRSKELQRMSADRKRELKAVEDTVKLNADKIASLENDLSAMRSAFTELTSVIKSLEKSIGTKE